MSMKPLIILLVAAIILGTVAVLSNRPNDAGSANALFAPQLAERLDDIQTIRIVGSGNTLIAALSRTDNDWIVDNRGGYRADTNLIRSALTQLSRASVVEAKTSDPAQHALLGVGDVAAADARGIAIEFLPASLNLSAIVLGDTSGTSYRFARLADTNASWLINADPNVPADTAQWLQRQIMDVDGRRVARIVVSHADGETLDLFKSAPEQPNYEAADIPDGRSLQYPGVANVIGNVLRNLRLEDVAPDESTSDGTPDFTTEFFTFDGLIVTASGQQIDGSNWLEFSARTDEAFNNPSEQIAAEAQQITATTTGWRYRIAAHQYSQIGRRIDDLLAAADDAD